MGEGAKSGPTFNGASQSAGGPAPPPAAAHRRRRSSCCGLCCILKYVLGLLVTLILIVGIAALVIWLVLRPSEPKFYVDTVQFNSITNSTSSNIVLGMSVRNPNKKIGIYYDTLRASASYSGGTVAVNALEEFYQGHKNTTTLGPLIVTIGNVYLPSNSKGVEDVELKLRSRVRFRVGKVKTNRITLKVKCPVSVPLNETSATAFTRKKCKVDWDR